MVASIAMRTLELGRAGARTIYSLPNDILLLIISYISVKDIITLRKSSKRFYELTKMRWVWSDAVQRHVIDRGLPVPAAPAADLGIKGLSAQHLEARTVHSAKFNDNWYSTQPNPRRAIDFQVQTRDSDGGPMAVREILFLKGRCGEFLLTLTGDKIECWEVPLDGSGAYRVAEWAEVHGIEQLLVNDDTRDAVEVAFLARDSEDPDRMWIYTLSLDTFRGLFLARSAIRGSREQMAPVHALHGDYIIMGDPLLVWHTKSAGSKSAMAILKNETRADADRILTVKVVDQHMVVVRARCLEVYAFPRWSVEKNQYLCTGYIVSALAMDAHPVREAAIVVRPRANSGPYSSLPPPVTVMLLQSTSTFTQLDLVPRKPSNKDGLNAPYDLPISPTRIYQIAPSSSQLKVSSGGKGIWIQTHNITTRPARYPARCIVGFEITSPRAKRIPVPNRPNRCEIILLKDKAVDSDDVGDVQICQSQLYARRCDMSEIIQKKYSIIAADLEDSVGRIAVGDRWGKVEILDYA